MEENLLEEPREEGLQLRPLEEVVSLVQANDNFVRAASGIPTKVEIEIINSDSTVPAIMCDPTLTKEEFLEKSKEARAIIFIAYATGTIPPDIISAIKQKIDQGVSVFILSNNPGEDFGIKNIKYGAGTEAYEHGAIPIQKANINNYLEVRDAIYEFLDKGITGEELSMAINQIYSFQEGEEIPEAEWDNPGFVRPLKQECNNPSFPEYQETLVKNVKKMLINSGTINDKGAFIPLKDSKNYGPLFQQLKNTNIFFKRVSPDS